MSLWKGRLCNSTKDVIIDSLLLIAVVRAFVPQIYRLHILPSSHGVLPYYVLFNAILSNCQLSEALLLHAFGWPSERSPFLTDESPALEQIVKGRLKRMAAYGAILGLLHILVQWSCSMSLVVVYTRNTTNGKPNSASVSIQAFLHFALVVIPAVIITLPKPSDPSFGPDSAMALIGMLNRFVAPVCLLLPFYAQYREYRRHHGDPGAVSVVSLCLQLAVMTTVAIRLFVRLGTPHYDPGDSDRMPIALLLWDTLNIWYAWGMLATNYVMFAIGCAFLVCCYYFGQRGDNPGMAGDGERTPLLA